MDRTASSKQVLVPGIVGGLLAGVVVSLWFLGLDLAAGRPFATPAILGQALMQLPEFAMTPRLIIGYTVLHYGVFVVLGIAAALFVRAAGLTPNLLLGLAFGIVALDVVYYGALLITGASLFEVLAWYEVLPANALAGVALMAYLHRAGRETGPFGWGWINRYPLLGEGLATGMIGAAAVAIWFLLVDIVAGRPFHTPAALGSALWLGAESEAEVRTTAGLVAGYTVVHVGAFAAAGFVLSLAATYLERAPSRALVVALALLLLEALTLAILLLTASWVLSSVGLWAISSANVVAVIAMAWWLSRTHGALPERLRQATVDV